MPRRTAIASVCGGDAGVTIGAVFANDFPNRGGGLLIPLALQIIPMICVSVVCVLVIRRWIGEYTTKIRAELAAAAKQRHLFDTSMDRRLAELNRREEAANRTAAANEQRFAELHQALRDEREAHARLRAEYEELTQDYNRVVVDALQQSADLFRPRQPAAPDSTASSSDTGDAHCIPMPTRYARGGGAAHHPVHDAADRSLR
jgi:hypothetical protein